MAKKKAARAAIPKAQLSTCSDASTALAGILSRDAERKTSDDRAAKRNQAVRATESQKREALDALWAGVREGLSRPVVPVDEVVDRLMRFGQELASQRLADQLIRMASFETTAVHDELGELRDEVRRYGAAILALAANKNHKILSDAITAMSGEPAMREALCNEPWTNLKPPHWLPVQVWRRIQPVVVRHLPRAVTWTGNRYHDDIVKVTRPPGLPDDFPFQSWPATFWPASLDAESIKHWAYCELIALRRKCRHLKRGKLSDAADVENTQALEASNVLVESLRRQRHCRDVSFVELQPMTTAVAEKALRARLATILSAMSTESSGQPASNGSGIQTNRRPAYARDHLWLNWFNAMDGRKTKNIYGIIRDRWNNLSNEERRPYEPCNGRVSDDRGKKRSGWYAVRNGIAAAKRDLPGEP